MVTVSENEKKQLLEQRKSIQGVKELKVIQKILIVDGGKPIIEELDYRAIYVQGIETYAALLFPYFDSRMQKYYKEHIIFLEGWWPHEVISKIKNEKFLESYKNAPEEEDGNVKTKTDVQLAFQCREGKQMFLQLNLFTQRTNLLSDPPRATEEVKR